MANLSVSATNLNLPQCRFVERPTADCRHARCRQEQYQVLFTFVDIRPSTKLTLTLNAFYLTIP